MADECSLGGFEMFSFSFMESSFCFAKVTLRKDTLAKLNEATQSKTGHDFHCKIGDCSLKS